jgi:hypothetical protein
MGRKSASGSGIRDEQLGSYFLELRNHFFGFLGLKYLNSLMWIRDPGSGMETGQIQDGKKSDPGSGLCRIRNTSICCLDSSLGRVPTCDEGNPGSIPSGGKFNVCVQGKVLVHNVIHYVPVLLSNHHL